MEGVAEAVGVGAVVVVLVVGLGVGAGSGFWLQATSPNVKAAAKDKLSMGFNELFIPSLSGLSRCFSDGILSLCLN